MNEPVVEREYDSDADLAGCWNVLVAHARDRQQAGELLHPMWLPRDGIDLGPYGGGK